ncbi:MAG: hypothetical protein UV80_C0002G0165 [Candidatus Peregrinibacteria bacterium GW2011_GWF2_43_17]|nr:MAG: hypothetical protein UV80_C0002G0165 [Candidatus Peregrinibacteria bacterium GW2011_GWF2_43_17]KKT20231.1 MAG: hypothetical protein UW03_C0007G0031 [Candidatus Peregrinibacteria bacterium GW2011_GWA2_43_8]HAU39791.1 hypothetical protein [Candidatus Peregrinibacteria bacterium]
MNIENPNRTRKQLIIGAVLSLVAAGGIANFTCGRDQARKNSQGDQGTDQVNDDDFVDTAYEPALEGDDEKQVGAYKDQDDDEQQLSWREDEVFKDAGRELRLRCEALLKDLKGLKLELEEWKPGDELPNWVTTSHCDNNVIFLMSSGDSSKVDENERPEDAWSFEYYQTPPLRELQQGYNYQLSYSPPATGDVGSPTEFEGKLFSTGSSTACKEEGEELKFVVETQDRGDAEDDATRITGKICAPNTREVIEETPIPEVVEEAREVCDMITGVREEYTAAQEQQAE